MSMICAKLNRNTAHFAWHVMYEWVTIYNSFVLCFFLCIFLISSLYCDRAHAIYRYVILVGLLGNAFTALLGIHVYFPTVPVPITSHF